MSEQNELKHFTYNPETNKYTRKKTTNLYPVAKGNINSKIKLLLIDETKPKRKRNLESALDENNYQEQHEKLNRD